MPPTGFESDQYELAKLQVRTLNNLTRALDNLTHAIMKLTAATERQTTRL